MLKYFYTILLVVFSTLTLMAQPPKPTPAKLAFNVGKTYRDRRMFNEGIAEFKKAIMLDKKYDSAYLELAQVYVTISKPDSALKILKQSIKQISNFAGGYIMTGEIYRADIKTLDTAIINYLIAIKIDSTNKETYTWLAWCYNSKQNYRDAIKYGVKALDIDNNYKPAYNELGHAYHALKAYEECIAQFKKNLAISVNDLPILYTGYSYIELKQKENAVQVYETLNKRNPKMGAAFKKKLDAMQ